MRKSLLFLFLLSLVAFPAAAQNDYPRAEVYLGYNFLRADLIATHENAQGWEASLTGNFHKNIGLEADFAGHYGRVAGIGFQDNLFLFGPRIAARRERVTPWAHALFGWANSKILTASSNDFAFDLGGGLDVNVHKHVALRPGQVDYIFIRDPFNLGSNSNNFRYSAGLVFKF